MMFGFLQSHPNAPARERYGRLCFGLVLVVLAFLLMNDPAFAAGGSWFGGFGCSGGHAYGSLYDPSIRCPQTLRLDNIFTFLICHTEQLSGDLLGEMYCGLIDAMLPAVMAMLTLSILFFGTGFTIGVIPATARDFQLFLLKIAFIFVFATQADAMIGLGYNLLVSGLREGTAIGLSVLFPDDRITTGQDVYGYLDRFLGQAMRFATDYVGQTWDKGNNPCKNAVFAVLALMAVAFPPIFFIGVLIVFRVGITFLRAVFGYLYSIVGITFLLTLSPIFLSFYLFKQTRPFFDKWLGYLVSFGLQMVILFCFLGFILSINVQHISGSLVDIIMPVEENNVTATMRMPWHYCTICDFKVVDETGKDIPNDVYGTGIVASKGKLACKEPRTPIKVLEAAAPQKDEVKSVLMKFAAYGLMSLLILAYLVEYLLNYVGMLSSFLAGGLGANYAPQMAGGYAINKVSMDMPGGQLLDTFERGVTDGYTAPGNRTSIDSAVAGITKGMERLVLGGGGRGDTGAGVNDPGLVNTFTSFVINPHRDPIGH